MNETNFSVGEEEREAADHGEDPGRDGGRRTLDSFVSLRSTTS